MSANNLEEAEQTSDITFTATSKSSRLFTPSCRGQPTVHGKPETRCEDWYRLPGPYLCRTPWLPGDICERHISQQDL